MVAVCVIIWGTAGLSPKAGYNTMTFPPGVCESESHLVLSESLWPHGLYSPWNSPGQNTGVDSCSNPGIETRSPALQTDSLPSEPPGKPRNTRVGSLSLLQWIFLTQESNCGLLHCSVFFTSWATREAQYDMPVHSINIYRLFPPILVR